MTPAEVADEAGAKVKRLALALCPLVDLARRQQQGKGCKPQEWGAVSDVVRAVTQDLLRTAEDLQQGMAPKPGFPPLHEIVHEINGATGSLHAIERLALDAINVGDSPEQGAYLVAIKDIARLHGRALDRCAEALTGGAPQTGCFDDWPDGPYRATEEP